MPRLSISENEIKGIEKITGLTHVGEFLSRKGIIDVIPEKRGVKKMIGARDKRAPNSIINPTVDKDIARGITLREYQNRPTNEDHIRGIV